MALVGQKAKGCHPPLILFLGVQQCNISGTTGSPKNFEGLKFEPVTFIYQQQTLSKINLSPKMGRGGGASGRAVAFCPSEPGSNPGTDLAFSGSELFTGSILAGRRAFSKER